MNHFIIDYDSTFIKVESLDELSKISNGDDETINNKISEITNLGMEGKISFSDSLRKRIELIECNKEDIVKTVEILEKKVSDSFKNNVSFLKNNAENILIVSSGFHELIEPIVIKYGIKKENIFANKFLYDNNKVIDGFFLAGSRQIVLLKACLFCNFKFIIFSFIQCIIVVYIECISIQDGRQEVAFSLLIEEIYTR